MLSPTTLVLIGVAVLGWPPTGLRRAGPVGDRKIAALGGRAAWRRRFRPGHLVSVVGAAAGLAGAMVSAATGLAAAMVATTVIILGAGALRRRRARDRLTELSAGLRLFARELSSGASVSSAVAAVSASGGDVADLLVAIAADVDGRPDGPPAAWADPSAAQARHPPPLVDPGDRSFRVVAARLRAGWAMSVRHGIPLAAVVRAIGDDLDDRRSAADRRSAQTAGPALSGYLLAGLPVAGLALGTAMGARPVVVLTSTPLGGVLLVAGAALSCAGLVWSARLAAA
jgi:tight adherence protein B